LKRFRDFTGKCVVNPLINNRRILQKYSLKPPRPVTETETLQQELKKAQTQYLELVLEGKVIHGVHRQPSTMEKSIEICRMHG